MLESPSSPDISARTSPRKAVVFAAAATGFFALWGAIIATLAGVASSDSTKPQALFTQSRIGVGEALFVVPPGLEGGTVTFYVRDPESGHGRGAMRIAGPYTTESLFQDAIWSIDGSVVAVRLHSSLPVAAYDFRQHKSYTAGSGLEADAQAANVILTLVRDRGGFDLGHALHPQGSNHRSLSAPEADEIRQADEAAMRK